MNELEISNDPEELLVNVQTAPLREHNQSDNLDRTCSPAVSRSGTETKRSTTGLEDLRDSENECAELDDIMKRTVIQLDLSNASHVAEDGSQPDAQSELPPIEEQEEDPFPTETRGSSSLEDMPLEEIMQTTERAKELAEQRIAECKARSAPGSEYLSTLTPEIPRIIEARGPARTIPAWQDKPKVFEKPRTCLLYTSPSPRDRG